MKKHNVVGKIIEELIVPKEKKTYYMNETEKKEHYAMLHDFHDKVRTFMCHNVHSLWEKYLNFKRTETYFCISVGHFDGKNLYMVKYEKPFNPTPEQIEKMKGYVLDCIKEEEDKEEHKSKFDKIRDLIKPAIDNLKNENRNFLKEEDVKFSLDKDFSITIKFVKPNEFFFNQYKIKCTLKQSGEITIPETEKQHISTLDHARLYINEFESLNNNIWTVALVLKNNLPKEYFLSDIKSMTKEEALDVMIKGKKVRNKNYSDGEYLIINDNGLFETEDGHTHGNINDEFWTRWQKETDWYLVD